MTSGQANPPPSVGQPVSWRPSPNPSSAEGITSGGKIGLVVTISVFLCIALPEMIGDPNVGGSSWSWKPLAGGGVSYVVPKGWKVTDPFHAHTPYKNRLWYHQLPAVTTRVAYLREPGGMQAFLQLGSEPELAAIVEQHQRVYDGHPLCTVEAQGKVETADKVSLQYAFVRMRPGLLAGEDITMVLAFGATGSRAILLNGGGPTKRFDRATFLALLKSLRVQDSDDA